MKAMQNTSPGVPLGPTISISCMMTFNLDFDRKINSLHLSSEKISGLLFLCLSGIFQDTESVACNQSPLFDRFAPADVLPSGKLSAPGSSAPTGMRGDPRSDNDSSGISWGPMFSPQLFLPELFLPPGPGCAGPSMVQAALAKLPHAHGSAEQDLACAILGPH